MRNKFKNSISNKKMKIDVIQSRVGEIIEEVTAMCPNINFFHNNFESRTIGQFKIFILGFSNLLKTSNKMSFSK